MLVDVTKKAADFYNSFEDDVAKQNTFKWRLESVAACHRYFGIETELNTNSKVKVDDEAEESTGVEFHNLRLWMQKDYARRYNGPEDESDMPRYLYQGEEEGQEKDDEEDAAPAEAEGEKENEEDEE